MAAHIVTVLPVKEAIDLNCINPTKLKKREYPSKICMRICIAKSKDVSKSVMTGLNQSKPNQLMIKIITTN